MVKIRHKRFTPENVERLINKISEGNYLVVACHSIGIAVATFTNWLQEGRKAVRKLRNGEKLSKKEKEKAEFYNRVKQAEAIAEERLVKVIDDAAVKDWRAAAWHLERRFPARWGMKQKVEHSGGVDVSLRIVFVDGESKE